MGYATTIVPGGSRHCISCGYEDLEILGTISHRVDGLLVSILLQRVWCSRLHGVGLIEGTEYSIHLVVYPVV